MLFFKSCPRCRGDLQENQDIYGEYKECLQCGYMLDIPREDQKRAEIAALERKDILASNVYESSRYNIEGT